MKTLFEHLRVDRHRVCIKGAMKFGGAYLLTLAILLSFELTVSQSCNGCCNVGGYTEVDEPRRSINSVWTSGQLALCDRTLPWGWYRFTSYVGGEMPTSIVQPNHCGTVAPIWIRGTHPSAVGTPERHTACINFFNLKNGCAQSFDIHITRCSGPNETFYVYFLRPTYSCSVAYCAGTITPCPYGQIRRQGNCVDKPVEFDRDYLGEPNITYVPLKNGETAVTLNCSVPFNQDIQSWINVTYEFTWFSEGEHLKTDIRCGRLTPEQTEYSTPCPGKPLFSLLEGMEYKHKLNHWISCNVTARYTTSPLNPWCIPKMMLKPFFVGLKVSPKVLEITRCSTDHEVKTLTITPTIPVGRSPFSRPNGETRFLNVSFFLPSGIQLEDTTYCSVEIRDLVPIQVRVKPKCVTTCSHETWTRDVIVPEIVDFHSLFWNPSAVHLPSIVVFVKCSSNDIHSCKSYTDPHYYSFPRPVSGGGMGGRIRFEFMGHGDFLLYNNTERNFEVHTRQWACGHSSVTCNCGVVFRDHNDVIEFNCCNKLRSYDHTTPMRLMVRSKRRLGPGISITQTLSGFNSRFQVLFSTGVKATVYRNFFGINIELQTPRARNIVNESGLCLYAGDSNITAFGYKFRMEPGDSYFDRLPYPVDNSPVEYKKPCSCYKTDAVGLPICLEEFPVHFSNIMDQPGTTVNPPTGGSGERKKRNVEYSDDLTEDDFNLFKRSVGEAVTRRHRRALSQIPRENATRYCTEKLSNSDIGKLCSKLGTNVQALVNSCSIDLELTGDTSFAISIASLMMDECGEITGRNLSSYANDSKDAKPDIPSYLSNVIEKLCPNDCSFNGRCVNGSCICNEEFTAKDCAISIYQIPEISLLQGNGLCDRRQRPCRKVTVMGSGFVNSTNVTCHVREFKVINNSWTLNKTEIRMSGVMTDLVLVDCHLPESPVNPGHFNDVNEGTPVAGLVISLSNDGVHKSVKNLTFISYDSVCMSCNVSTGCVLKENACFINRYCFASNDPNPLDWCYQCLPDVSNSVWTKRQLNLPPRFLSTTQYYGLYQENLELKFDISDPEGMPVTISLINRSPSEAIIRDKVLLWNATKDAKTRFFLNVTDACQAFIVVNITVGLVACQCQNNGNCVPHPNKPRGSGLYHCDCVPGFTGDKCENNINECQSYPCVQGRCIDEVNDFKCICDSGYVGKKCDVDYDDCGSSPCVHGNCTDYTGAYRCSCDPGYGGQNCTIDIDECQSSPCGHGICIDQANSYQCQCHDGYTGSHCDVDINECQSSPCIHGTCVDQINQFTCNCDAGFTGSTCEVDINDCLTHNCGNGTCVDLVNNYTCNCNGGFEGRNCDLKLTSCKEDSCYPNVTCHEIDQAISCGPCPLGLTGDGKNCADIDYCINATCKNGASCVDGLIRYVCTCATGFTGDHCETDIDDCVNHTCLNGGSCVDGLNSFSCNCSAGFTGAHCVSDIDDCVNHTCANGGSCVDGSNNYSCNCSAGFTGPYCETVISSSNSMVTSTVTGGIMTSTAKTSSTWSSRKREASSSMNILPSINNSLTATVSSKQRKESGSPSFSQYAHVQPSSTVLKTSFTVLNVPSTLATPDTTREPERETEFKIKIIQDWNGDLKDKNSDAFKDLASRLEAEIWKAFFEKKDLLDVKVISFSKGSIVAQFQLRFSNNEAANEAFSHLKKQISDRNLGSIPVDPASLQQIPRTQGPPTPTPTPTPTKPKIPYAIIVGATVGGIVVLVLACICLVSFCKKKKVESRKRRLSGIMPPEEAFPNPEKYEMKNTKSMENIVYFEEVGFCAKPVEGEANEAFN